MADMDVIARIYGAAVAGVDGAAFSWEGEGNGGHIGVAGIDRPAFTGERERDHRGSPIARVDRASLSREWKWSHGSGCVIADRPAFTGGWERDHWLCTYGGRAGVRAGVSRSSFIQAWQRHDGTSVLGGVSLPTVLIYCSIG